MSDVITESYEVKSSDGELHAINVMLECLERHVSRESHNPNCEDNIEYGRVAVIRCAKYVLERVS